MPEELEDHGHEDEVCRWCGQLIEDCDCADDEWYEDYADNFLGDCADDWEDVY